MCRSHQTEKPAPNSPLAILSAIARSSLTYEMNTSAMDDPRSRCTSTWTTPWTLEQRQALRHRLILQRHVSLQSDREHRPPVCELGWVSRDDSPMRDLA